MNYQQHPLSAAFPAHDHVVYAIRFDDGRIKVGVTSNPRKRSSYYEQEGRRNHVPGFVWWNSAPMPRTFAYLIEKEFCRANRHLSMPRHREWFDGVCYESILNCLQQKRQGFSNALEENAEALGFQGACWRVSTGANV